MDLVELVPHATQRVAQLGDPLCRLRDRGSDRCLMICHNLTSVILEQLTERVHLWWGKEMGGVGIGKGSQRLNGVGTCRKELYTHLIL